MNRWSKIVLGIGLAGLAGWIATGLQGRLVGAEREALALHTLAAFASTLALILADAWIVIFLGACERSLERAGHGSGGSLAHLARATRLRRTAIVVGAPWMLDDGRLMNCAFVIARGSVCGAVPKCTL